MRISRCAAYLKTQTFAANTKTGSHQIAALATTWKTDVCNTIARVESNAVATSPWIAGTLTPLAYTRCAMTKLLNTGPNGKKKVSASPMTPFRGRATSHVAMGCTT